MRRKNELYEDVMDIMNNVIPNYSANVDDNDDSVKTSILNLLRKIEGAVIKLRSIHWDTKTNSLHKLTDDMIGKLPEYEDDIAEDYMGVIGIRLTPGSVTPVAIDCDDVVCLSNELISSMNGVKKLISTEDDKYCGISNVLDDMTHYLNKCKYLATMDGCGNVCESLYENDVQYDGLDDEDDLDLNFKDPYNDIYWNFFYDKDGMKSWILVAGDTPYSLSNDPMWYTGLARMIERILPNYSLDEESESVWTVYYIDENGYDVEIDNKESAQMFINDMKKAFPYWKRSRIEGL